MPAGVRTKIWTRVQVVDRVGPVELVWVGLAEQLVTAQALGVGGDQHLAGEQGPGANGRASGSNPTLRP